MNYKSIIITSLSLHLNAAELTKGLTYGDTSQSSDSLEGLPPAKRTKIDDFIKPKKSVRFNDTPTIHTYEIPQAELTLDDLAIELEADFRIKNVIEEAAKIKVLELYNTYLPNEKLVSREITLLTILYNWVRQFYEVEEALENFIDFTEEFDKATQVVCQKNRQIDIYSADFKQQAIKEFEAIIPQATLEKLQSKKNSPLRKRKRQEELPKLAKTSSSFNLELFSSPE